MSLGVLDNDCCARADEGGGEDFSGDEFEAGHIVWRIGEDEVEGPGGRGGEVLEDVAADEGEVLVAEFGGYFEDEFLLYGCLFDGCD